MKVKLIPVETNTDYESVVLVRFPVVVGRSREVELPLEDRWVSRRHCELVEQDGTLIVRDLGSKHGTLVNNAPIKESRLLPGDRLSIGLTTFRAAYRCSGRANSPSGATSTSRS